MKSNLNGLVALITGASSGIGAATARQLAGHGAALALVARRTQRLTSVVEEIEHNGGTAVAIRADISDRVQAASAVTRAVKRFGRLDIVVNNAGLMLLGPVVDADVDEWDRMLAVNVYGALNVTHSALPHLLKAAAEGPRQVADIVNVSSVAGRAATDGYGVYNLTKFGLNGFTESLRQEVAQRHIRVGVIEPGGVNTELASHNSRAIQTTMIDPFHASVEALDPDDVAESIAYMVTRPRRAAVAELWIMPTEQLA